jgi:hypothetical protein
MRYFCLFFFLLGVSPLRGVNYYVAPWGDDNFSGLSWDSSFATTQHAADVVIEGDSVFVADGDYTGFDLRTSGTSSLPIVFVAYGDSVTIIDQNSITPDGINIEGADWVVIDGFNIIGIQRAGIRVVLSRHVIVRNNVCTSNGKWGIFTGFADSILIEYNECSYSQDEHGIYFSNSADYPVIRNNLSHHNNGCGIHMNGDESMGGDGFITHAVVECNIIYENGSGGGSGINCDGVAESLIFNNLLYMNHSSGISLYRIDASAGSYNDKVFHNTIVNASDGRWCLNINTNSTGDTLYNNILVNLHSWRGSISIDSSSIPGFFSDYNIVVDRMSVDGGNSSISLSEWQLLGYGIHSMLADSLDSLFVNWQGGDYHLRGNCQAVDSGTSAVSSVVPYDLDGIPRPQGNGFDIGAYEFHTGAIEHGKPTDSFTTENLVFLGKNGYVEFSGLEIPSIIFLFDISGRLVERSGRISTPVYRFGLNDMRSGVYFFSIVSPRNRTGKRGKIIFIR